MRRCLALSLIAAILSVTSIPLLPSQPVCAHAGERMQDCAVCHGELASAHDQHAMHNDQETHPMGHNHGPDAHTGHSGHEQVLQSPAEQGHDKALTDMEKECRIECGCGCHHSADGLPFLLSHHVTASVKLNHPITLSISDTEFFSAPEEQPVRIPLPPPQFS